MAGIKHHHIWQLLQRGFGERRGRDHHVWVYSKDKIAEQTATRLFGAEKYFYGPEGSQADINITEYENETQSVIQDIRKLPDGATVDPEFAAILISHLEMRSSFLREDASEKMQRMMTELLEGFSSPSDLRDMMSKQLVTDPKILNDVLSKLLIPQSERGNFLELAKLAVRTMPNDEILKSFSSGFGAFSNLIDIFPEIVKEGQNKALSVGAIHPDRADLHRHRNYSVFRIESGEFILPDTTLAFIKKEGAAPFVDKDNNAEAVILPISNNVAIIGRTHKGTEYSVKTINRVLAGCSFRAFIAKERDPRLQGLTRRIGKYARLLSEKEVKKMVKSALPN